MKSVGIICECNPFHSGHRYLIERARESGADCVVAVMSGYFTQRGEAAIADPYSRARALLGGGADLVLELPFPYSCAGAEFFAGGGVDILSRLSVDELWFGSECGDIDLLRRGATIAADASFVEQYEQRIASTEGTARAYFDLLSEKLGGSVKLSSNDILGISYLCAIERQRSGMRPVTVSREGSAYLETTLQTDRHPSATALRHLLLTEGLEKAMPYLLPETSEALASAEEAKSAMASLRHAERAILAHFRMQTAEAVSRIAELEGGLGNRLIHAAEQASSLEELIDIASTKKYTTARIQRGILFSLIGVERADYKRSASFVRVLAANRIGCAFLAEKRKMSRIPTVTRQAEIPDDEPAKRQEELHKKAVGIYTLCLPTPIDPGVILRKNPLIFK